MVSTNSGGRGRGVWGGASAFKANLFVLCGKRVEGWTCYGKGSRCAGECPHFIYSQGLGQILALEPRRGLRAFLREIFPSGSCERARGREARECAVPCDLRRCGRYALAV